jgi:hypothetical protein
MKRRRRLRPNVVADRCLEAAWMDDIDDRTRKTLEQAHDVIQSLMARSVVTAKVLEVVEAELAAIKYPLLNDDDDPGMGL